MPTRPVRRSSAARLRVVAAAPVPPHRKAHGCPAAGPVLPARDCDRVAAARLAEDDGDWATALAFLRATRRPAPARWLADLSSVACGVPPWQEARAVAGVVVRAARRTSATEAFAHFARVLVQAAGLPPGRTAALLGRYATSHPVVIDAALVDGGVLAGWLATRAGPHLLNRLPHLTDWSDSPIGVHRVLETAADLAVLRDRRSGTLSVAVVPSSVPPLGSLIYARLVSVPGQPGLLPMTDPLPVDEVTAARLLRVGDDPEQRLRALAPALSWPPTDGDGKGG